MKTDTFPAVLRERHNVVSVRTRGEIETKMPPFVEFERVLEHCAWILHCEIQKRRGLGRTSAKVASIARRLEEDLETANTFSFAVAAAEESAQ